MALSIEYRLLLGQFGRGKRGGQADDPRAVNRTVECRRRRARIGWPWSCGRRKVTSTPVGQILVESIARAAGRHEALGRAGNGEASRPDGKKVTILDMDLSFRWRLRPLAVRQPEQDRRIEPIARLAARAGNSQLPDGRRRSETACRQDMICVEQFLGPWRDSSAFFGMVGSRNPRCDRDGRNRRRCGPEDYDCPRPH